MKLALISGLHDHNLRHHYRLGYHMFLAQYILRDYWPDQLLRNYRRWGYFIILDNGTPEGSLQSNVDLLSAYDTVQPDELILPDVLENIEATLAATIGFVNEYAVRVDPIKRMVVPQGNDLFEWGQCLDRLVKEVEFASIGVPKHLEGKEGGRVEALRYIQQKHYHTKYYIHLLGCYKDPIKEVREAVAIAPWIRGIDTAAPIGYAQANKDIQCGKHYGYSWDKDFDEEAASYNLDKLLRACAGG